MVKRLIVGLAPLAALLLVLSACNSAGTSSSGSGSVSTSTSFVSFPGTTTDDFSVTSGGAWTASTNQSWLSVSPSSGSASGTVTLTVNRSGLTPGSYAGSVLVQSGDASAVVTVSMRFADVSGNITGPAGQILPQSVGAVPAMVPGAAYVAGQVLMKVSAGYLAVQGLSQQSLGGRITPQGITPQAVQTAASTIAQAHGLRVQSLITPGSAWAVVDTGGRSVAQAVTALRADGRVAVVQPNYLLHLSGTSVPVKTAGIAPQAVPTDPLFSDQWDMTMLGMPNAWDTDTGSSDVVVAVVDSGVMASHPDLQANVPYAGYDFVLNQPGATTPVSDGTYHGTHVAGTIGAVAGNGVGIAGMNWHVSILPVRACDASGCAADAVARGIDYAAGLSVYNSSNVLITPPVQARVINLSLGGSTPSPLDDDAIAYATGNGTVVVAAAGNNGKNCGNSALPSYNTGTSPSAVAYPAAYPDTIAVGSVDYDEGTNGFAVSCFSDNGAPTSDSQGVTVAAPGGFLFDNGTPVALPSGMLSPGGWGALGIVSTYWDATNDTATYASDVGTSMATPHVVGLAALMLAEDPSLTPTLVKLMLEQTAHGGSSSNPYIGYGVIVPINAIDDARSSVTANASDFIVELVQGGTVVEQTRADAGGNFILTNVPAGSYTLEAGNDANHNGVLGDVGEFYGQTTVAVGDSGDVTGVGLDVQLQ